MKHLFDLIEPSRLTSIVDIGANPIDGDPPYKEMLAAGYCRVVGFEPQAAALSALLRRKGRNEIYLPYAIGDGRSHQLHVCEASGMTGLFPVDRRTVKVFPAFEYFGKVKEKVAIDTKTLDEVNEIDFVDFLKIDVQGAELAVFENGREKLKNAVAIQTEVSWISLYEGQPTIGEVDLELRRQGFIPHAMVATKNWIISPCVLNKSPYQSLNQLLESDLVYVRDFRHPEKFSDEMLKQLAMVAYACYNSFDLAMQCILQLQNRSILPVGSVERFTKSIPGERVPG